MGLTSVLPKMPPLAMSAKLRAAGAVIIGKTNLHEFAYGGTGDVSYFGPCRNPVNPEHMPGGSSSGSAAAVAAGVCPLALGTDTAGSVRIPAALCGIVGLKPTFGRVSTQGVVPLSWSQDHVGPLTATVEDAALSLSAMCDFEMPDLQAGGTLRIGICRELFFQHLDTDVRRLVEGHPGHDTMFYNVLRQARHEGLYIEDVFGPQHHYFKHPLIAAARRANPVRCFAAMLQHQLLFLWIVAVENDQAGRNERDVGPDVGEPFTIILVRRRFRLELLPTDRRHFRSGQTRDADDPDFRSSQCCRKIVRLLCHRIASN